MPLPYSEKVLEHFKNPRNVGRLENYDAKATEGSPACGDMVSVYLKVDKDTKVIKDISFESYGCASNIATGSIVTEMAKGQTLDEAKKITWEGAMHELEGLPTVKAHCSVLAVSVLRAALKNYEEKFGLIPPEKRVPTTVSEVEKRLSRVINPVVGMSVIKTKTVKNVEVMDGIVSMEIDLPQEHQFAAALAEDIREKLEYVWDIKEVKIRFAED